MTVRVRPATPADRDFALALIPRLRAFGDVPLRTAEEHDRAEGSALEHAIADPTPDDVVYIAELEGLGPAGVAFALTEVDYFSGERHGHLSILAVREAAAGRGVGRALLDAVEAWARGRGYRFLDLNAFAANARARAVYEKAGYVIDTIRYAKELR